MESSRMDKVNKEIKKAISEIIHYEAKDERLKTFSISEVEVSKDLHYARVKVLERNNRESELIKHLNNARSFIRKLLAEKLSFLRYIPELFFEYDRRQEKIAEVYKLMEKVEEERIEAEKKREQQKRSELYKKIWKKLGEARKVLILTHVAPDGDAIGAVIAMGRVLTRLGVENQLFFSPSLPEQFSYLAEGLNYTSDVEKLDKDYNLILLLDVGDLCRTGLEDKYLTQPVVNIDHHISNNLEVEFKVVEPKASSTGEIIYNILEVNNFDLVPQIAEALYLSIYTDTGRFSYENTTSRALEITSQLLKDGASPYRVFNAAYESRTFPELLLGAEILSNAKLDEEVGLAWCVLDKNLEAKYKYDPFALKEIVNELRSAKEVEVSVFFKELDTGKYKLSFRSKGTIDVNKLANHFGGGGHQRAAGAVVEGSVDGIIAEVKREIKSGKYQLLSSSN